MLPFFWKDEYFVFISNFLQSFAAFGTSKMSNYLESSDIWFTNEGLVSDSVSSQLSLFIRFLFYLTLTYVGFNIQLKRKDFRSIYYMAYVAMLFYTIGGNIEIYRRFYNWLIFAIPVLTALVLRTLPDYKWGKLAFLIIIIYVLYYQFISSMFITFVSGYGFIWDR